MRRPATPATRIGTTAAIAAGLWLVQATALATSASAVMPPEAYRAARIQANHHVQITITDRDIPWITPGLCTIHGTVDRVFRTTTTPDGAPLLTPGMPLALTVDCLRRGDKPLPSGTLWSLVSAIKNAKVMEAYVTGDSLDALAVAAWQYTWLPEVTDAPICTPDTTLPTCW